MPGLQRDLLAWFRACRRDLPWRRTRDPYAIWISEVMLQQTQVATVIPYWERFLSRFPTVDALGSAPLDDVLALWSGLGYYARARNLHRAAQVIIEKHGGVFPSALEALRALPGFGPYTAAAVGSIAFGLDAPLVDGNVARVFCRLGGWTVGAEQAREMAWPAASEVLPIGEAGDWNQALMELGAMVCTPASPKCGTCPVARLCRATAVGDPARYPLAKERRTRPVLSYAAVAIRQEGAILLQRRASRGLFGGLWEVPSAVLENDRPAEPEAVALARSVLGAGAAVTRAGFVSQTLTHREVRVEVFTAVGRIEALPPERRLVGPEEISTLGVSSLTAKVLAAAGFSIAAAHGRRRSRSDDRQTALL